MRRKCYSEASDVFSFGVVLYEMLARRTPWDGHETLDVAFRVCSGERMAIAPSVLPAIAAIIDVRFPAAYHCLLPLCELSADVTRHSACVANRRPSSAHDEIGRASCRERVCQYG